MSSEKFSDGELPMVCERCGHREATPAPHTAEADDNTARRAGQCPTCGHGWLVPARSDKITLRRKPDRRTAAREK